jgi:hypothetical protein
VPGAASEPEAEADSEATPDEGGATAPEDGCRGRPVLMMGAVGAGGVTAPEVAGGAGGTAAPKEAGGAGGTAAPKEAGTAGGTAKPGVAGAGEAGGAGKPDVHTVTVTVKVLAGAQTASAC